MAVGRTTRRARSVVAHLVKVVHSLAAYLYHTHLFDLPSNCLTDRMGWPFRQQDQSLESLPPGPGEKYYYQATPLDKQYIRSIYTFFNIVKTITQISPIGGGEILH